jgi:GMP synthase (glutamine-hydrolysing)
VFSDGALDSLGSPRHPATRGQVILQPVTGMATASRAWVAIQHVPYEGPGMIAEAASRRGLELRLCHSYRGESLPSWEDLDGLVVMGGPMGVHDTAEHPYLAREGELIAAMVRTGRPVLGVCLGAQLLADALGASVHRGGQPELGCGAVSLTAAGREDPVLGSTGAATLPVVHWHEETFELPTGASLLASSVPIPNQAFRVGERAYGLQFHVEVERELARTWRGLLPEGALEESAVSEIERAGRVLLDAFFGLATSSH